MRVEKELEFGWKVYSNQEVRVFREGEGSVALFLKENSFSFGNAPSVCLLALTEDSCELMSDPQLVKSIKITLEKEIWIDWLEDFMDMSSAEEGIYVSQQELE